MIVNGVRWLLGDNESGKTTLVSKFRGVEEEKKGAALEYAYVAVKDEYGDGVFFMSAQYAHINMYVLYGLFGYLVCYLFYVVLHLGYLNLDILLGSELGINVSFRRPLNSVNDIF